MTDLEDRIVVLRNYLDTAEQEVKSLKGGRKASSARSRKALMELKRGSHELRKSVMQFQRDLPTKSKPKADPIEVVEDLPPPPELKREESEASVKPKTVRKPRVKKQIAKTK